jgi:hypothetical protein
MSDFIGNTSTLKSTKSNLIYDLRLINYKHLFFKKVQIKTVNNIYTRKSAVIVNIFKADLFYKNLPRKKLWLDYIEDATLHFINGKNNFSNWAIW